MSFQSVVGAVCTAIAIGIVAPVFAQDTGDKVTPQLEQAIPNIPGKSLIALVVDYPPGAASAPHIHAESAFIYAYVISGEIESKVNDEATRVYKAGESWSEPPGSSHPVSRNASKINPAKLLAIFVVDTSEKKLTTHAQ